MREDRLGQLQAAMREREVAVCAIAGEANLRWLLDYESMAIERLTALVATPDSAVMILPDFDVAEFEEVAGRPQAVGWADRTGPDGAVEETFALLGSPAGPALVDEELPYRFFVQLRDRLGDAPGLAGELLGPLLLRKSADEVERIGRTGELISRGIDFALENAEPGMTELALKQGISNVLSEGGSESLDYVLVQAGPNAAIAHHTADTTAFRLGEPVLIDIEVRLDGYYADIAQQVFLGDPSDEYLEHYEIVRQAQEAGVQAAVVGATAHDVASAASKVIDDAGLSHYGGPRTGHGLGVSPHEGPSVVEGNHSELVAGTVITVEPGVYIPGAYGIRIEDTLVVTDGGPRRLTRGARELTTRAPG